MQPKKQSLPPEIAKLFTERHGYANYFFNQHHRERVWHQFHALGDFTWATGVWTIEADMQDRVPVRLEVGDRVARGRIGNEWHALDFDKELSDQLAPRKSGGLLLALHQWRRLLVEQPEKFGEVHYLGTAPLSHHEELADVIVATYDALETWFYFDQQDGTLLALEMYPDVDVDPCEIVFGEYQEHDARRLPAELTVVFGDEVFGTFHVQSIDQMPANEEGVP